MKTQKYLAVAMAAALLMSCAGCSGTASSATTAPPSTSAPASTAPAMQTTGNAAQNETYMFTDSAGREVELPRGLLRIAPSGPLAQIVLYTLCPDKMAGWATEFTDAQRQYIDGKYAALPVFGNFYGDTLNLESVMAAGTQVIIDIGEQKQTTAEDMDGIQAKTGLPVIFIRMELDSMASAYETLGAITGETEQAKLLADYIGLALSETRDGIESIPEAERLSVYYGQDEGLTAIINGSPHAAAIELAGGTNVAEVERTARGGVAEISMEQLMLWDPDVVLFAPGSIYASAAGKPEWAEVGAIKSGRFYEVPSGPYNWMGNPPSVNRVLGVRWLANLLYPDVFGYDLAGETVEFYRIFYHCDITAEQARALMAGSTYR